MRASILVLLAASLGQAALGCTIDVIQSAHLLPTWREIPVPPELAGLRYFEPVSPEPGPPPSEEERTELELEANARKLKVSLRMDRQEYLPGQIAHVTVSIENPTAERVEVPEPFAKSMLYLLSSTGCGISGYNFTKTRWFEAGAAEEQTFDSADRRFLDYFQIPEKPGEYMLAYSYGGASIKFRVLSGEPELLSVSGDGRGQGAILYRGKIASSDNRAGAGDFLEIYGVRLEYACPPPRLVTIGNFGAEIVFFGKHSRYEALYQVNVRVPEWVQPGPAVPVQISCGGHSSNQVTIGVR